MKGQFSIIGILMVFVTLVIFSAIIPTVITAINNATEHTDPTADLMLELIPLFMVIAIIMSVFVYARPFAERVNTAFGG